MKLSHKSSLMIASAFAIMLAAPIQNAVSADYGTQQTPSNAATYMGDSTITAKVKAAIVAEPDLSALEIKVNTSNGAVTLTGAVDSQQKIERAAQVTQAVEGVKNVTNNLSLKAPG